MHRTYFRNNTVSSSLQQDEMQLRGKFSGDSKDDGATGEFDGDTYHFSNVSQTSTFIG